MIIIDNNIWPREYTLNEFKIQYPNIPQKDVIHFYKMKHKQFVDNQHQQLLQQQQILEYQEKCEDINLENNWLCGTQSNPGGSYSKLTKQKQEEMMVELNLQLIWKDK